MSDLGYYLIHRKVQDENWWVFRVVAWYCRNRRIDLPKGRCHFGEITLLYAPAYFVLGVFFRALIGLGKMIKFATAASVWVPIVWFVKRADQDSRVHKNRGWVIFWLSAVIASGSTLLSLTLHSGHEPWVIQMVAQLGGWLATTILLFLAVWAFEATIPRFQPVVDLGRGASQALQRPTLRQLGKTVVVGTRHSLDFGAIMFILAKDGWRKVCPRLEYMFDTSKYVDHDSSSTSGT